MFFAASKHLDERSSAWGIPGSVPSNCGSLKKVRSPGSEWYWWLHITKKKQPNMHMFQFVPSFSVLFVPHLHDFVDELPNIFCRSCCRPTKLWCGGSCKVWRRRARAMPCGSRRNIAMRCSLCHQVPHHQVVLTMKICWKVGGMISALGADHQFH